MRGITLEEIAESTKIGTRSLRALEEEDFDKLPGGIFNKGFVRAYAKYLGIDEEQAVTDFMTAFGEFQQQMPVPPPAESPAEQEHEAPRWNAIGLAVALVLLVVCGGIWYFSGSIKSAASRVMHRGRKAPVEETRMTEVTPPPVVVEAAKPAPTETPAAQATSTTVPAPKPTPSATPSAPQNTPATAAIAGEFVLQFRAQKDSWVSITADDKLLMEGTLKGDKTVHAKNKVVFKTGNAGAVEVSFNGEVQPALGGDNQVKTVVVTASGMQR